MASLTTLPQVQMLDLLPPSLVNITDAQALTAAIDAGLQPLLGALPAAIMLSDLDHVPERVLDIIARQLHVDTYEQSAPLATNRALVKASYRFHRRAGTRAAVEEFIAILWDEEASLIEWFEHDPPLTPGTFKVLLTGALAEVDVAAFIDSIRAVKRESDHVYLEKALADAELPTSAGIGMTLLRHLGAFEV